MPVLDGLGATSRLRAAGFWRPIVALTASAAADARAACLAAGCNDHLTKPIAASELVSKMVAEAWRSVASWSRRTPRSAPRRPTRTRSRASGAGGRRGRRLRLRSFAARAIAAWRETPYCTRPTAVENVGVAHHLGQAADALGRRRAAPGCPGSPRPARSCPASCVVPPVMTAPDASMSSQPRRMISAFTNEKISSMRGWMMSRHSVWRDSTRGARPPTDATSSVSSSRDHAATARSPSGS